MRARRRSIRPATSGVKARPIATPGSKARLRPTPATPKTSMLGERQQGDRAADGKEGAQHPAQSFRWLVLEDDGDRRAMDARHGAEHAESDAAGQECQLAGADRQSEDAQQDCRKGSTANVVRDASRPGREQSAPIAVPKSNPRTAGASIWISSVPRSRHATTADRTMTAHRTGPGTSADRRVPAAARRATPCPCRWPPEASKPRRRSSI